MAMTIPKSSVHYTTIIFFLVIFLPSMYHQLGGEENAEVNLQDPPPPEPRHGLSCSNALPAATKASTIDKEVSRHPTTSWALRFRQSVDQICALSDDNDLLRLIGASPGFGCEADPVDLSRRASMVCVHPCANGPNPQYLPRGPYTYSMAMACFTPSGMSLPREKPLSAVATSRHLINTPWSGMPGLRWHREHSSLPDSMGLPPPQLRTRCSLLCSLGSRWPDSFGIRLMVLVTANTSLAYFRQLRRSTQPAESGSTLSLYAFDIEMEYHGRLWVVMMF
ncbi:hypothetical protein OIU74_024647 [Salix koriyanagi]|uniref:Uncharacterized protein n=1 Tax=Salix koriyanagi TaxID=2511006 RepID=A0A9Q1A8P4_9ROSI|nr:hypothetical protein OIU74_024647 [Salix koriyanagi]